MSKRLLTHHLPAVAWTVLLGWLLTVSADRYWGEFSVGAWVISWSSSWADIAAHFVLFGVMGLLWTRSLEALGVAAALPIAVVFTTLFGIGLEIAQSFIPGRGTEGLDMIVNGIGAAAFSWVGWSGWLRPSEFGTARL